LAYEKEGEFHSECLDCDLPQAETRELITSLGGDEGDTYCIRQPATGKEIESTIASTKVCYIDAIRYGGKDLKILKVMFEEPCNYISNYISNYKINS